MVITDWFYHAAVSGADPIESRPGIVAALARIAGNGVRTIIVETANRFARDLMVQEVGFAMLRDLGITLIAADSPASFLDDGPTSKLIRQILGAVAEFDKASKGGINLAALACMAKSNSAWTGKRCSVWTSRSSCPLITRPGVGQDYSPSWPVRG
jgi:hypothetical protein